MSKYKRWENLAQIALRIINIPPTEAACERMFSARREIITKHMSNIRDKVVEASAYLKAGLSENFLSYGSRPKNLTAHYGSLTEN